jgi:hypothetical protein
MLWYRSWRETRYRFAIALIILTVSALSIPSAYRQVSAIAPTLPAAIDSDSELGRRILDLAALAREYRGYVWSQWFRQNLASTWTLFAAILGGLGILSQTSRDATLFTLSLPISRRRLALVRAGTGLAQIFALVLLPTLLIVILSPRFGQHYALGDALVHSACFFIAGSVFFSLAFLLSTVWSDAWRPALVPIGLGIVIGLCEQFSTDIARFGIFRVMSGEDFFRGHGLPWLGLAITGALSSLMLYGAAVNLERRDF